MKKLVNFLQLLFALFCFLVFFILLGIVFGSSSDHEVKVVLFILDIFVLIAAVALVVNLAKKIRDPEGYAIQQAQKKEARKQKRAADRHRQRVMINAATKTPEEMTAEEYAEYIKNKERQEAKKKWKELRREIREDIAYGDIQAQQMRTARKMERRLDADQKEREEREREERFKILEEKLRAEQAKNKSDQE